MSLFIIHRGCPNCGGEITDDRLIKGYPCYKCLPRYNEDICDSLRERGKLEGLSKFCETERFILEFSEIFKRCVGAEPWSLQKTWAKRFFNKDSFAIVAPTGVGKTTFGLVLSLILDKSLLIFPTKALSHQAYERLIEFAEKVNNKDILLYKSTKKHKEKLEKGDFDILIGTNMFFHKNLDNLMRHRWNLIFIDDTDSFLKSSKNIEGLFKLLGFSDEDIKVALKEDKNEKDYEFLEKVRNRKRDTVLIISSATLKPKTSRVRLFRHLLGFDIQKAVSSIRNIVDSVKEVKNFEHSIEVAYEIIGKVGKGGLLFISNRYGKDTVGVVSEYLRNKGLKVLNYLEMPSDKLYEEMSKGEFDVALGLAHLGNPLIRGLDFPSIIRYAIFIDVPKFVFPVKDELAPSSVLNLLMSIYPLLEDQEKLKFSPYIKYLQRYRSVKAENLDNYPKLKRKVVELREFLDDKFKDKEFINKINSSEEVSLEVVNGNMYITIADASTYVQASGRTSRLITGGLTKGLSIVLYWDKKSLESLKKRLTYYFHTLEVEFEEFDKLNIDEILGEIDKDRERARRILEGEIPPETKDIFKTTLVIVESPNKARTIASFFGKPQLRMVNSSIFYDIPLGDRILSITASLGHILDLKTSPGMFGVIEKGFLGVYDTIKKCTKTGEQHTEYEYLLKECDKEEIRDKYDTVEALRKISYEVDEVFIATDPDAEGEKIAYDIYALISPYNKNIYRSEFHEITPKAFKTSLEEKREFNINRVKAQITRRIADRWVGFTLSRILWRRFGRKTLSAGRVQTPVLGWIIDRAFEYKNRIDKVVVYVGNNRISFTVEDKSLAYEMRKNPEKFSLYVSMTYDEEKSPPPPYTTDTILYDASRRLKLSADKTMRILQDLFENGIITYHRTDSTYVSEVGRFSVAKPYISKKFGEDMFMPRIWSKEGAHECIRPTRPITPDELRFMLSIGSVNLDDPKNALRVYRLIFNRFIASQMRSAKVKMAEVMLSFNGFVHTEVVPMKILSEGYNSVLRDISPFGEELRIDKVEFLKVPKSYPYTQGTLIQEMKNRGLGRPSTYAQIVQTLLERGYVVEKNGYLFPTRLGIRTYMFLKSKYADFISEEFTRELEKEMDEIEANRKDYMETLGQIYKEVKKIMNE